MSDQARQPTQGENLPPATFVDKGKGKAAAEPVDDPMEEEDESDEDEEHEERPEDEEEEEDEDNMEEIDQDNIIGGRRTRGKNIDFAKADQELTAEGNTEDDDEDEDDDFHDEAGEGDSEMRD